MDEYRIPSRHSNQISTVQNRLKEKYSEEMSKTYHTLMNYNPALANEIFHQKSSIDRYTKSAIKIQSLYRGYKARILYRDLLYESYMEEVEETRSKELKRMEESMLMVETVALQEKLNEKKFLVKQRSLEQNCAATLIQRRYRKHKGWTVPKDVLSVIEQKTNELIIPIDTQGNNIILKILSRKDLKSFPLVTLLSTLDDLKIKSDKCVELLTNVLTLREELRESIAKNNKKIEQMVKRLRH